MRVVPHFSTTSLYRKRTVESKRRSRPVIAHKRMQYIRVAFLLYINSTLSKIYCRYFYLFRGASSFVMDRVFVLERGSKKTRVKKKEREGRKAYDTMRCNGVDGNPYRLFARCSHVYTLARHLWPKPFYALFLHRRIDRYSAVWKGTEFVWIN